MIALFNYFHQSNTNYLNLKLYISFRPSLQSNRLLNCHLFLFSCLIKFMINYFINYYPKSKIDFDDQIINSLNFGHELKNYLINYNFNSIITNLLNY